MGRIEQTKADLSQVDAPDNARVELRDTALVGQRPPITMAYLTGFESTCMLSEAYGTPARGPTTSSDTPAYRLQEPVKTELPGFMSQMHHWEWQDP